MSTILVYGVEEPNASHRTKPEYNACTNGACQTFNLKIPLELRFFGRSVPSKNFCPSCGNELENFDATVTPPNEFYKLPRGYETFRSRGRIIIGLRLLDLEDGESFIFSEVLWGPNSFNQGQKKALRGVIQKYFKTSPQMGYFLLREEPCTSSLLEI